MDDEWWSWMSYWLGVASALVPSVLFFLISLWRAPVMDDDGRIVREDEPKAKGSNTGGDNSAVKRVLNPTNSAVPHMR